MSVKIKHTYIKCTYIYCQAASTLLRYTVRSVHLCDQMQTLSPSLFTFSPLLLLRSSSLIRLTYDPLFRGNNRISSCSHSFVSFPPPFSLALRLYLCVYCMSVCHFPCSTSIFKLNNTSAKIHI